MTGPARTPLVDAPVVVALGGNALARRGEPLDAETQRHAIARAAEAIAPIASIGPLVVTDGNGPQVGLLADMQGWPFDVLDAETEGMIGYMLELELGNRLPGEPTATILTLVLVDPDDPAFTRPTKPIGPVLEQREAERLARFETIDVARDGKAWRRVVPSPEPKAILQLPALRTLVQAGHHVICLGGGGIPVVRDDQGRRRGIDAVIDKDLVSALLAIELDAASLLLLTDVPGVLRRWGSPDATLIKTTNPIELRALSFEAGSMGPKVEAACRYVEATGRPAMIGALSDAPQLAHGSSGTTVAPA